VSSSLGVCFAFFAARGLGAAGSFDFFTKDVIKLTCIAAKTLTRSCPERHDEDRRGGIG
jgi:hypothetical protein